MNGGAGSTVKWVSYGMDITTREDAYLCNSTSSRGSYGNWIKALVKGIFNTYRISLNYEKYFDWWNIWTFCKVLNSLGYFQCF